MVVELVFKRVTKGYCRLSTLYTFVTLDVGSIHISVAYSRIEAWGEDTVRTRFYSNRFSHLIKINFSVFNFHTTLSIVSIVEMVSLK